MADPVVRLDTTRVAVEPGGQAQVVVTITSASSIVEGFALDLLGAEPTRWAEVVPPSVDVYPGAEATAVIVFSPPASASAPSGEFAFGLRARSTEDPDASAVAEGDVTLGKVSGLQAKIIPVTSSGRWRGRHVIQLSNWGNTPVQLQLVAADPDAALGFYLRPDLVDLPIGGSATVRLTVRTRKPFLRGTPVRLPFQVIGEPADAPPGPRTASPYGDPSRPVVDAALNQKPILSRSFVTVVALALLAAVAGGAYAFTRDPPAATSLEQLGPPEKPQDFTVVATGPTTLKASWTPIAEITGYKLLDLDPPDKVVRATIPVDGSLGQKVIPELLPDTLYCYKLVALRESKQGPPSDEVCVQTPEAPPSPSPTPVDSATPIPTPPITPPPGTPPPPPPGASTPPVANPTDPGNSSTPDPLADGVWVVAARTTTQEATPETVVTAWVEELRTNGFPNALLMDSTRYPDFRLTPTWKPKPLWLAVLGPYPDEPTARAEAERVQAFTGQSPFVVMPDPPG